MNIIDEFNESIYISKKIKEFSDEEYTSIEYSKIYFSLEQFLEERNKISEIKQINILFF